MTKRATSEKPDYAARWAAASDADREKALERLADIRAGEPVAKTWRDAYKQAQGAPLAVAALLPSQNKRGPVRVEIPAHFWKRFEQDYLRRGGAGACPRFTGGFVCGLRGRGWATPPSLPTFTRRAKEIPAEIMTRARGGVMQSVAAYPSQRRSVAALSAGESWNGDGMRHDVFVTAPNGVVRRPVSWMWQDVYSRKILAWRTEFEGSESSDLIRLAFLDAANRYGFPKKIVIDNTRAAANRWLAGVAPGRKRFRRTDVVGAWQICEIETIFTGIWRAGTRAKGHGQAKPIERAFRDIHESQDKHPAYAGAYTGRSTSTKPENYEARAIDHNEFTRVMEEAIAEHNARTGRKTEMAAGGSFDEAFQKSWVASEARFPIDEEKDLFLLAAEARKISREGTFTIAAGSVPGVPSSRFWHPALSGMVGKRVVARFDPDDLHAPVRVFAVSGEFICQADAILPTGFHDTTAAREHSRARREHMKVTKRATDLVTLKEAQLAALHAPPEIPAQIEKTDQPGILRIQPPRKQTVRESVEDAKVVSAAERIRAAQRKIEERKQA